MKHFTQLRYLHFYVCKPDLDTAFSAIISDCGKDIRNMLQSYGSAKDWLTVQVRYDPANPRDQKNKPFEFYLTCALHGSFGVNRLKVVMVLLTPNPSVSSMSGSKHSTPPLFANSPDLCLRAFFSSYSEE